jgi:hypothetical protein
MLLLLLLLLLLLPMQCPPFHLPGPHPELAKLLGNRTRALLTFEDANFDVEAFISTYCGSLSETAMDNARQDLGALLATATEEVSIQQQHCVWTRMTQQ